MSDEPLPSSPQILLEDGPLLAVDKPAGLATEAPPGVPSLVEWVKASLKEKYQKPGGVYLGVPHRLDRPVSGVVLFAKNSKAAARLAEQFRDRQVKKTYFAVVEGTPEPSAGTLVHWTAKNAGEAKAAVVEPFRADAKECLLRYETLGRAAAGTVLRVELGTGRFHQIRVQMSASGWPVVGDVPYGGRPFDWGGSRNEAGPSREGPLLLHAWRLTFFHPVRYDLVSASAPLPGHWPADVRAVVADAETGFDLAPHP